MHNDSTPHLNLPLPHLANLQEEDVPRLRDAITQIDTALVARESSANKGQPNGYAGLDSSGKVPAVQLPSFVDDIQEAVTFAALPNPGETGKIYVTLNNNRIYRWSGSSYIEVDPSPGSTDSVPEGSTNVYFTAARVLSSVLTGLAAGANAVIAAADTVLVALAKLQAQITVHKDNITNPHGTTAAQVGAPTTTGTGASGNWPINVTGNATNITGIAAIANGGHGASNAVYGIRNLNRGANYYINSPGAVLVPGGNYQIYTGGYGSFTSTMPAMADTAFGDEIRVSNMFGYWGAYPWTLNCPANVVFAVPGGAVGVTDAQLVCDKNIGGFTLRCSYHSGSTAYWSIV